jgi:hypothetical protein
LPVAGGLPIIFDGVPPMFNKSIAFVVSSLLMLTAAAHAEGEVDMTGGTSQPPTAPLPVAGVNSSGAPFTKGTLGVSFSWTLLSNLPTAVAPTEERVRTIDLLYFLSEKAALDLVVGINVHRKQVYNNATPPMASDVTRFGFAVGGGYRMYTHRDRVATFIEPLVVLDWANANDTASLAITAIGEFGVEAMLSGWCSLSGAIGAGVSATNKVKDIQLATTANLAANLYWK